MKKQLLFVLIIILLLAPATAFADKTGFVDFGKVLELTDKGRQVQKQLAATKDELEIKVQEMELGLRKLQDEIRTKADVMSEEVKQQKMEEFQKKMMEYQKAGQDYSMQFEKLRVEKIRGFVKDMEAVVQQVAKEKGFSLVIMKFEDMVTNSSLILYGDSSVDLTDQVIQKLNAGK